MHHGLPLKNGACIRSCTACLCCLHLARQTLLCGVSALVIALQQPCSLPAMPSTIGILMSGSLLMIMIGTQQPFILRSYHRHFKVCRAWSHVVSLWRSQLRLQNLNQISGKGKSGFKLITRSTANDGSMRRQRAWQRVEAIEREPLVEGVEAVVACNIDGANDDEGGPQSKVDAYAAMSHVYQLVCICCTHA